MRIDELVEPWSDLARRLDAAGTVPRWALAEPVLAGIGTVSALGSMTAPGASRQVTDPVIGALSRLAAVDGGDDLDAAEVLLRLLTPGVLRIAVRLRCEPLTVLAELWCQIRTHPWRHRRRGFAAGLLLDTKATLLDEFRAGGREVPVSPFDPVLTTDDWPPADTADTVDVFAVIDGALRSGAVTPDDVALVMAFVEDGSFGADVAGRLARSRGVCVRTVRRRRAATLAALRDSARRVVGAVA